MLHVSFKKNMVGALSFIKKEYYLDNTKAKPGQACWSRAALSRRSRERRREVDEEQYSRQVFDQTTRLPNGRNLGSHSHKQATRWKSSPTTPHTRAERRLKTMNSALAQQWRRTPRPPHGLYVGTLVQLKGLDSSPRRLHPGFIAMAHVRPHTVHDPSLPRTNAITRRLRSSRHEPLLSTRLGHPLDCAFAARIASCLRCRT
jgi:hypothetical protein